ncbi:NPC intracellular cholesterol transporter 2-like [Argonauta hians]
MASIHIFWSLFIIVSVQSIVQAVKFVDCGSKLAKLDSLEITGCTTLPCKIRRGESMQLNVTFTPNTVVHSAKTYIHGIIRHISLPFPISNNNACVNSGLTCPLAAATPAHYHFSLDVSKDYPSLSVIIKWELRQDQTDIICFEISAVLV